MPQKLKSFMQELQREFQRVNWPNRQETARYTLFVIGFSLATAAFLGLIDWALTYILINVI